MNATITSIARRECCGAANAFAGEHGCCNCSTVAQHDRDADGASCTRCIPGAREHDFSN
jgi:hypothetical protein